MRNISRSWCIWCQLSSKEWKVPIEECEVHAIPLEHMDTWTITELKVHKLKILDGDCKTASNIHRVVDYPLLDFIDISYYIFPVLQAETGLCNDILH